MTEEPSRLKVQEPEEVATEKSAVDRCGELDKLKQGILRRRCRKKKYESKPTKQTTAHIENQQVT